MSVLLAFVMAIPLLWVSPASAVAATHIVADDEFSFVVIPDTQGYVKTPAFAPTFGRQTRWIADSRDDLNIAFVTHLGDLVESWPNPNGWRIASEAMAVLDSEGVPNTVLPGNHDMNIATGEAPLFDQHFPPSRYSAASWNSPAASYGGYLGQNLFGPDPVDRKNKDNFALFSAEGFDFVLLNLEYGAPDYALAWAQKVLNAYPDRRAILATHSFIHTGADRSSITSHTDAGANSPVQIWEKFVYGNCSISLVVNGHWHDGEVSEARRSDVNRCGQPVTQLLTNYQDRANGGDGWLRYYTFKPSKNLIEAVTYSPTLDLYGQGPLSSFSFPYDLSDDDGATTRTLVSGGSSWRWRFAAGVWPAGWTGVGFADTSWPVGSAVLGFGSTAVKSNVDVPAPSSNRPRSALFRQQFQVVDASKLSDVKVTTRADDGVVVHVNGVEVGRSGMVAGTITADTYASAAPRTSVAAGASVVFTVPAALLRNGTNVVTASTHLNYRATPDISFDLAMSGTRSTP